MLIGDSIGAQWFSALANPLTEAGWRFIVYTKSACPIVDQPFFYVRIGMLYGNCALWRERTLAQVAALEPDLVFIGSDASYPFDATQWREGTLRVLQALAPEAGEVFLLQGTLALPFDGPACLARRARQWAPLAALTSCSAAAGQPFDQAAAAGLQAAAAAWDNVYLVDMNPMVCAGAIAARSAMAWSSSAMSGI